jgi:hypothetical protein
VSTYVKVPKAFYLPQDARVLVLVVRRRPFRSGVEEEHGAQLGGRLAEVGLHLLLRFLDVVLRHRVPHPFVYLYAALDTPHGHFIKCVDKGVDWEVWEGDQSLN